MNSRELAEELLRHLAWQAETPGALLREAKVAEAPRSLQQGVAERRPQSPPATPAKERVPASRVAVAAPSAAVSVVGAAAAQTLAEIRAELGDCQRCKLCSGRKQIVFGVGNPKAKLMFVGEGPGEQEDLQGVPFVGKAGQLLTKMIEAMGYARDDVYIANVVKCRPPQNRNPEPDEIAACEPFLRAQIRSIAPQAIVALGKFAAQTLLRDGTAISRLRGKWTKYEGVPLMPTFHPAYLLRNEADKRLAWADLQQVMAFFGDVRPGVRPGALAGSLE